MTPGMMLTRQLWWVWSVGAICLVACTSGLGADVDEASPGSPTPISRPATVTPPPTEALPLLTATPFEIIPTVTLAPLTDAQRQGVFDQVWTWVRDRYVYPDYRGVDWDALRTQYQSQVQSTRTTDEFYALMERLVEELGDEHSYFLSPQGVADRQALTENALSQVGIGVSVLWSEAGGRIIWIIPGAPAQQAGLKSRDLIVAIDGIDTTQSILSEGELFRLLRGSIDSVVTVSVQSGAQPVRDIQIRRRPFSVEASQLIRAERVPTTDIGLLVIDTFDLAQTDAYVRAALLSLEEQGPLTGLIIDVRNNLGGSVEALLQTLALFIDGGNVGSARGSEGVSPLIIPSGQTLASFKDVPIVVLTSPDTTSGGEVFAAGMQALQRAQIVGLPTAGNTENVVSHRLSDGSEIYLAERIYHLPNGTTIEDRGAQPDLQVDVAWWQFSTADDPQIQAAIQLLQQR
jgi:carboxyl-terminal processing protease